MRNCVGWIKQRSALEKTLLSLSSILLLTLFLMVIIGIAFRGEKSNSPDGQDVCWTKDCIQIAGSILSSMVPEADSCTDFYNLACGGYGTQPGQISSVAKESADSAYLTLKNLLESPVISEEDGLTHSKSFYSSCVQFGNYRPKVGVTGSALLDLMNKVGISVWPLLDPLYDTSTFSLEHTLVSLVLLDVHVVFRMDVVPDERIKGSYLIKISPGGPHESGRSPGDIRSDTHLTSSILTSLLLLGVSAANTNNDVSDILFVDSSFAAIEQEESTPCDFHLLTPEEAVSELNRIIPEINWAYVLSAIRRSTGLLRSNFAVQVYCKHKIRDYVVHLNDLSIRSATNYLGWRFFSEFVENIIPTLGKFRLGRGEPQPRWRSCLELLEKFSSPHLSKALAADITRRKIHKEVEKIGNATLATTLQLVKQARWLDPGQKSKLNEKVNRIQILYPFQDHRQKELMPHANMSQVTLNNFTSTVIHLQRQWVIRRFKKLAQDESSVQNDWVPLVSPMEVSNGGFTIPTYFDKMQSPYLRQHVSPWMNFGGLGVAIARQISELMISFHVDESGSDSIQLFDVWLKKNESRDCFRKYLNNIENLPPDKMEDLLRYLFVESSALEITFESAKTIDDSSVSLPGLLDWSSHKLFFLSYTQGLCEVDNLSEAYQNATSLKDRFKAALSASRIFKETFTCTSPTFSCQIWT